MILRALDPTDADAMAQLHAACFLVGWKPAEMAAMLDTFGTLAVGLFDHGLKGFVMARLSLDEADVLTIAVDATERRKGHGRQLLEALAEPLRAAGARRLMLEVAEDNLSAQRLYAQLGARQVGVRKNYYATADGRMDARLLAWKL